MGPLSLKQKLEEAKFLADQARKEELHQVKLQEAVAKANQGIGHKEEDHQYKMSVAPLAKGTTKVNRQKLGLPSLNPLAGTEVLGVGQKKLPGMKPMGTDTVPAMLTPGEAVIPAPAAQDPKNKKAIAKMVKEGRNKNKKKKTKYLADGSINIKPENEGVFTEKANEADMSVQEFAKKVLSAPLGKYSPETRKQANFARNAAEWKHYENGTMGVGYYEDGEVEVDPYDKRLYREAPKGISPVYQVDEKLLEAQRMQESGNKQVYGPLDKEVLIGRKKVGDIVTSESGAVGISQIMPQYAHDPGFGVTPLTQEELNDPEKQKAYQRQMMAGLNQYYKGDLDKSFTAYNAGFANVDKAVKAATEAGTPKKWKSFMRTTEAKQYAGKVLDKMRPEARFGEAAAEPAVPFVASVAEPTKVKVDEKTAAETRKWSEGPDMNTVQVVPPTKPTPQQIESQAGFVPEPVKQNVLSLVEEDKRLKEAGMPSGMTPAVPPVDDQIVPPTKPTPQQIESQAGIIPEQVPPIEQASPASSLTNEEWDSILESTAPKLKETIGNSTDKSFIEKAIASVFGPTGLFNEQELARFAIVAAGGLLTGGSWGGSLRYAAADALKTSDARRTAEATEGKTAKAAQAKYYNEAIDAAVKTGEFTPEAAKQLKEAVYKGNYLAVERAFDADGKYGTFLYQAGLDNEAKPIRIVKQGHTTSEVAYLDPVSGDYLVPKKDDKGNVFVSRVSPREYTQVSDTEDYRGQRINQFKEKLLNNEFFKEEAKTGKGIYFDIKPGALISELETWASEQRRLGLPDDYSAFADQINNVLAIASKSGDRRPKITKYLDLVLINTSALTNPEVITKSDGSMIKSSEVGSIVSDIKANHKILQVKDNETGKLRDATPTEFIQRVNSQYNTSKEVHKTPSELADLVTTKDPLYQKIKDAPNSYWAYMYYYIAQKKKESKNK